jgi:PAS domain S-box-containing protein
MSQQEIENDDAFFKRVIESAKGYAIFTTDKQGLILTWNAGAENIMLYKPEDIIGRSGNMLYTPEDIAELVPQKEMETSLREGRAINERFHVKYDRSRFWGSGLVFPIFGNDGEHIGFTKIMRNLSEEEEAQKNLKEERALAAALVNTYQEPLVILNADMQVVNVTPAFVKYFSLDKSGVSGQNFYQIIDRRSNLGQLKDKLNAALNAQEYYTDIDILYTHPEQGPRNLVVKLRRIYQPPNVLFSLEFMDRTDDQAIQEEKDVFISVASHEIRTPLSIIKAYGQVLERESKDAKPIVIKAVKKINEQISSMKALIDILLDTSRIASGKMTLDREVFNLSALIKEQIEAFSLTVPGHEIRLDKETDFIVFADRVRMMSVMVNLLTNAVKYSPDANKVIVGVHANGNTVEVSVQDFGIGIPKSEQSGLFQRFGRTQTVIKQKISGTGLGLHLASEIIKLEGGSISVTSEEGKGSTFTFSLPLYDNLGGH